VKNVLCVCCACVLMKEHMVHREDVLNGEGPCIHGHEENLVNVLSLSSAIAKNLFVCVFLFFTSVFHF